MKNKDHRISHTQHSNQMLSKNIFERFFSFLLSCTIFDGMNDGRNTYLYQPAFLSIMLCMFITATRLVFFYINHPNSRAKNLFHILLSSSHSTDEYCFFGMTVMKTSESCEYSNLFRTTFMLFQSSFHASLSMFITID